MIIVMELSSCSSRICHLAKVYPSEWLLSTTASYRQVGSASGTPGLGVVPPQSGAPRQQRHQIGK